MKGSGDLLKKHRWISTVRGRWLRLRTGVAALLAIGLFSNGVAVANAQELETYATWDDVIAAQGDVDEQNGLIEEINAQIADLKEQVDEAEQTAQQSGNLYALADQAATEQSEIVYGLQTQVDEASAVADEAELELSAYSAATAGRVTIDPTIRLLTNPGDSEDFLKGMSTLSKLGTSSGTLYEQANAARNNAEQLGDQAEAASVELDQLEADAWAEYEALISSQLELQEKRDNSIAQGAELEAMLVPLTEHRDVVQADYDEGERLREEERERLEEERQQAAADAAATAAAEAPTDSPDTTGAAPLDTLPQSSTNAGGYSPPIASSAYITSPYGMRLHPIYSEWRMHAGLDLVVPGGTCWSSLYAVTSGTVTYSGWMNGWGYIVIFQSDDGTVFKYPHVSEGGLMVYPGQRVSPGQLIAYAGTTGPSTGCHLHFQIEVGGATVEPLAWLAARGIHY